MAAIDTAVASHRVGVPTESVLCARYYAQMAFATRWFHNARLCFEYVKIYLMHIILLYLYDDTCKYIVEHLLYIASTVYFAYKHIAKCKMEDNYFVYAFLSERMHFFEVITFRMWLIIPLEVNIYVWLTQWTHERAHVYPWYSSSTSRWRSVGLSSTSCCR